MTAAPLPAPVFLTMGDVQRIVEATTLAAGVDIYDHQLVSNPSRVGLRLYADVTGTALYKVRIDLAEGRPDLQKSSCSCPRSKYVPICKHAAAVIVAWASAPRSFVEVEGAEVPTEEVTGKKKRTQPARGRVDTEEQVRHGLAAMEALLSELAHTGLGTLTQERVNRIRDLANNLRPLRLRRLAPVCIELASQLQDAVPEPERERQFTVMIPGMAPRVYQLPLPKRAPFSMEDYARRVADLTFQIRGLARLIERQDTDAEDYRRLADELLGRTWSEKQLTTVTGLQLLDLGWRKWQTPDGFLVEESLMIDVATGELYSDKMIRPPKIAKRGGPKEDFGGALLEVANAGLFPGYPPRRLKLRRFTKRPPTAHDVDSIAAHALDTIEGAYESYRKHAADPFAPNTVLVALSPSHLLLTENRLHAVDAAGASIEVDLREFGYDAVEEAVRRGSVRLVLGTIEPVGQVLTLRLLAIVTSADGRAAVTSAAGEGTHGPHPETEVPR